MYIIVYDRYLGLYIYIYISLSPITVDYLNMLTVVCFIGCAILRSFQKHQYLPTIHIVISDVFIRKETRSRRDQPLSPSLLGFSRS